MIPNYFLQQSGFLYEPWMYVYVFIIVWAGLVALTGLTARLRRERTEIPRWLMVICGLGIFSMILPHSLVFLSFLIIVVMPSLSAPNGAIAISLLFFCFSYGLSIYIMFVPRNGKC